ncbi:MAG: S8 family serine peptidase [Candidatus Thorarchaeota archaeon]|jgi:hypothetical protein
MVILIIIIASGGILLLQTRLPFGPQLEGNVRVAIVDSGIDPDLTLQGRLVAQKSFISPQYGYAMTDSNLTDSKPKDDFDNAVPHGTLVATAVVRNSASALLVNAKVVSFNGGAGGATSSGIIAAIYWAVEQNCSVINLSVGSAPTFGDPLESAVEYAFSKGVVVISAAGNDGQDGLSGTSISSPSVFLHSLSVAAIDDDGLPEQFTSYGPTASRYMKPDISALGYIEGSQAIYFGTSFASPRVAAVAADLIAYCLQNEIDYTAGTIMTALMKGASPLSFPAYVVGAGKISLSGAIDLISSYAETGGLPQISYVHPGTLPLDFETLFYGNTYEFSVRLLASSVSDYDISISSATPEIFDIPDEITINQTGLFPLKINVPTSGPSSFVAQIRFNAGSHNTTIVVSFDASAPIANIAFDISHTTWSIDTIYGQFKEFYKELVSNEISVTELRNSSATTLDTLLQYDAVVILDPCAWDIEEISPTQATMFSLPFSDNETQAYRDYYAAGGGIFVAALDNNTLDVESLNDFLNWTGMSLNYPQVITGGSLQVVSDVSAHPITTGVTDFAFSGSTLNVNSSGTVLARIGSDAVLGSMDIGGGRIVVTGTNYFIDNWGMTGEYDSSSDAVLALKIVLWISGLL